MSDGPLHENRARAGSFGSDAEAYDRSRPSYPASLVERVVGDDVLDVGCGTGKLGMLFVARGSSVLGIEPDERMAAVARSHGLSVEVSRFETWDDGGRRFDAVVAGQAWHWVDPVAGTARAADVLRAGGRVALFWNVGRYEDDVVAALQPVYDEHFPEAAGLATIHAHHDDLPGIVDDDRFGPVERWTESWAQAHTNDEWIDQLATHSNHRLLPDDRRERLFDGIRAAVDGVTVLYETVVLTAVRS